MMVSHRGLVRSWRLFRAFRKEQTDPTYFYRLLAEDSVQILSEVIRIDGALVVDVGAGPREFGDVFVDAGANYVAVDLDPGVSALQGRGVAADAHQLPLADGSVDVAFSSNLIEHVKDPNVVAGELLRVLKPGGVAFISYTNWLSPWGGHETSPWHWFGGRRAWARYERRHQHPPKNKFGVNMFAVSVAWGVDWSASVSSRVEVLAARPRYLPDWTRFIVRIPGLRELLTWNLVVLVRRPTVK